MGSGLFSFIMSLHQLCRLHLRDEDLVRIEHFVDDPQLFPGGDFGFTLYPGDIQIELAELPDLFGTLARMAGIEIHPTALLIETEDASSADDCGRPTAKGCTVQLAPVNEFTPRPFFDPPPRTGYVADIFHKTPLFVHHDEDSALCERVDVRIAAAAGEAEFRIEIIADAGSVDIAKEIHLGSAQEPEIYQPSLGYAEGVVEAGGARSPHLAAGITD